MSTQRDPERAARLASMGDRIRQARGNRTQQAVAFEAGCDLSSLSRYERGAAEPGAGVIARIAEVTGVDVGWILTGEGDGPKPQGAEAIGA